MISSNILLVLCAYHLLDPDSAMTFIILKRSSLIMNPVHSALILSIGIYETWAQEKM